MKEIVVGIDPGSQRTGYAVLELSSGASPRILDIGTWHLVKGATRPPLGERLEVLAANLRALLGQWNPRWLGLEKAVTFKSVSSAHVLSEVRGVVRLVAHETLDRAHDRLVELSPTAVKKEAAGLGSAGKSGVRRGLSLVIRGLDKFEADDSQWTADASDALAIAWALWVRHGRWRPTDKKERTTWPV